MRVRTFELRLIGVALVACWTLTAALVLLAYRPGGPIDVAVGLLAAGPVVIALLGVRWPPLAHGQRSFPAMLWLGIGSLLFLIPSIGGLLTQLRALGSQTLLPSPEAAYPWLLALTTTSLFTGFGIARRMLGQTAMRRRRLVRGMLVAAALTTASGALFTGAAVANDLALRDDVRASSRFGPTDPQAEPILCTGDLSTGGTAELTLRIAGEVDLRPLGSVDLTGLRSGGDYRWLATVVTDRVRGTYGHARLGDRTWQRSPGRGWRPSNDRAPGRLSVDRRVAEVALTAGIRATAEDHGVEVIEGARARHGRVAVDGSTFLDAFPQVRWLVGNADLRRWRGQLVYWIFLDGQLGQVAGRANGEATGIEPDALLATLELRLTATNRDREVLLYPPAR